MKRLSVFSLAHAPRAAGLVLALASLSACGGHHSHTVSKGRLRLTVIWPDEGPSRVIPVNARSLFVQVRQGATVVASTVVARPASTASFTELPLGSLSVVATAYVSTDGTGTALATATVPTTVSANNTAAVSVTLASTIDHLEVTPNPFVIGAGASATINVVGRDAANSVVLIDPTALSFASSNASLVSVAADGTATAAASTGSTFVTINEADSGKSLSLPLSVVPSVSLTPATSAISVRGTAMFSATVVGPSNTAVTWSVQEGSAGGAVSSAGLYTAPATHGTFHVVATSVADPTRSATATVVASSGGLNVTVH